MNLAQQSLDLRTAEPAVAVLFAREDSNYKTIPDADVWDRARDARRWPGGLPVVAHPPCRAWGRLRGLAKPRPDEKELALEAVRHVRGFGGVLEHPAFSTLWAAAGLPRPGEAPDAFGGWSLAVEQFHWGHKAAKATWLYIVGCGIEAIPPMPHRSGEPAYYVTQPPPRKGQPRRRKGDPGWKPELKKAEREHTPPRIRRLAVRAGKALP